MTPQELLNAEVDIPAIMAAARRALAWWLDELAAMAPAGLRDRLSSRPRLWLEADGEGGGWRAWRDGRWLASPPAPAKQTPIGLLLPPEAALVRDIPVPRLPAADIRRMVALDIDRLSPLAPDLIHHDVLIPAFPPAEGRPTATLAIVSRDEVARRLARARQDGYRPTALSVRPADGEGVLKG